MATLADKSQAVPGITNPQPKQLLGSQKIYSLDTFRIADEVAYILIYINDFIGTNRTQLRGDVGVARVAASSGGAGTRGSTVGGSSSEPVVSGDSVVNMSGNLSLQAPSNQVPTVGGFGPNGAVTLKQLDRVIALPMPYNVVFPTEVEYQAEEPSRFFKVIDSLKNGAGGQVLKDLAILGATGVAGGLTGSNTTELLQKIGRIAINPRKEQIFNDVQFRNFDFTFSFGPKTYTESQSIMGIIEALRFYMLPEIDKNGSGEFYTLPAEFIVKFMIGSTENLSIPRIKPCVLTSCTVNYTPTNLWAHLRNGFPPYIEMNLRFRELEIITRNKVFSSGTGGGF